MQHDSSELVIVSTRSVEELANQTAGTTREIEKNSQELERLSHQLNQVLKQVRLAV